MAAKDLEQHTSCMDCFSFCSLTTYVPHELLLYGKKLLAKWFSNVLQALSGWLFGAVCGADINGIR